MGLVWEKSFWVFFFLTLVIGGGAAWATGRVLALRWRPYREAIIYSCLLGLADRFLHWGLFLDKPLDVYKGTITSLHYYAVDTAVLVALASIAFRLTQASCMTSQYRWLYRRTSPFTWTTRDTEES
jgi:hypothetical protein